MTARRPCFDLRQAAKARGDKYYVGTDCADGHGGERYVSTGTCVLCSRQQAKRWAEENPEKVAERANSEKNLENCKAYHAANRDKISARKIAHYWDNAPEIRARRKMQRDRKREQMTESDIEREREKARRLYAKNPAPRIASARRFIESNPEKARTYRKITKARRRAAEGSFTAADIDQIRLVQRGRCAYCETDLAEGEHIDHVIPIALGGSNWPVNLQLTCPTCNKKKAAKHPVDFEIRMIREGVVSWHLPYELECAA